MRQRQKRFGITLMPGGRLKREALSYACLYLCLCLVLYSSSVWAEGLNRIIATVDDEPVTLYELRTFKEQRAGGGLLSPEGRSAGMSDQDILDAFIMEKLVDKEVAAQGLKARENDIDSYIERTQAQNNLTEEQMRQAVKAQGMTWELYRQRIAADIERAMLVNREIGSRVNVTPEDVERYYKKHLADYTVPEQVRVRHIFLLLPTPATEEEARKVQKQMEEIYQRVLAGEDFATLADTYSQGPGAGEGGDLGYFKKGTMAREIEEVAFTLNPGEVSKPFRTDLGLHLIKVEERQVAGHRPLEEVGEEIKNKLYEEALQKRYRRWFQEDLRSRHHIELVASLDGKETQSSLVSPPPQVSPPAKEEKKRSFFRRLIPFF